MTDTIHHCCGLPTLRHRGTCHDCGAVEAPMSALATEARGEPICENCERAGATDA